MEIISSTINIELIKLLFSFLSKTHGDGIMF